MPDVEIRYGRNEWAAAIARALRERSMDSDGGYLVEDDEHTRDSAEAVIARAVDDLFMDFDRFAVLIDGVEQECMAGAHHGNRLRVLSTGRTQGVGRPAGAGR